MAKIFSQKMKEGIITKIQDDVIIGGDTQTQTANNYIRVLHKLFLANLRVEPQKVIIFPESADIAGWIWKKGGTLSVSPHRKNSLMNMKEQNITKVKHTRSFLGLYKTLQMATPGVSRVLHPLEEAVAGKNSNDPLVSTHSLLQRFKEAKSHIKHTHTIWIKFLRKYNRS